MMKQVTLHQSSHEQIDNEREPQGMVAVKREQQEVKNKKHDCSH